MKKFLKKKKKKKKSVNFYLDRDMTGKLFKAKANKKNELLRKLETT